MDKVCSDVAAVIAATGNSKAIVVRLLLVPAAGGCGRLLMGAVACSRHLLLPAAGVPCLSAPCAAAAAGAGAVAFRWGRTGAAASPG